MPRTIRAVIFDSDGTLVDSEVPGMDILHEMACAAGLEFTRAEAHARFRGARMADIAAWIGAQLADKPEGFEIEFTRGYRAVLARRLREDLREIPGAFDLLSGLTIPFAVATNGPREKVLLTLETTGLLPLVGDRIFSAYDHGCFKPDPGLFLIAARALGQDPRDCAVVEDSLPGLAAGVAAGMRVFSLHERNGVPDHIANHATFIDSLSDLKRFI